MIPRGTCAWAQEFFFSFPSSTSVRLQISVKVKHMEPLGCFTLQVFALPLLIFYIQPTWLVRFQFSLCKLQALRWSCCKNWWGVWGSIIWATAAHWCHKVGAWHVLAHASGTFLFFGFMAFLCHLFQTCAFECDFLFLKLGTNNNFTCQLWKKDRFNKPSQVVEMTWSRILFCRCSPATPWWSALFPLPYVLHWAEN